MVNKYYSRWHELVYPSSISNVLNGCRNRLREVDKQKAQYTAKLRNRKRADRYIKTFPRLGDVKALSTVVDAQQNVIKTL